MEYSKILGDEKGNRRRFLDPRQAFFAAHGITVKALRTDNGSCYCSRAFAAALGPHLKRE